MRTFVLIRVVIIVALAAGVIGIPLALADGSDRLRLVTVRSGDLVTVKGHRLQCIVTRGSFNCYETGGFPRLWFLATNEGGKTGLGEFFMWRSAWFGAQIDTVAQVSRRSD